LKKFAPENYLPILFSLCCSYKLCVLTFIGSCVDFVMFTGCVWLTSIINISDTDIELKTENCENLIHIFIVLTHKTAVGEAMSALAIDQSRKFIQDLTLHSMFKAGQTSASPQQFIHTYFKVA